MGIKYQEISRNIMRILYPDTEVVAFSTCSESTKKKSKFILNSPDLKSSIRIISNPLYWVPETYSRGEWDLEKGDLAEFLTYGVENLNNRYKKYFEFLSNRKDIRYYLKQYILNKYFTRKVKNHYNIDPDIYSCFLDKEMSYTCAFYEDNDNLDMAQKRKYETIIRRLELSNENNNILNIGCGWGSFERYVIFNYDNINVVGLSISQSQIDWSIKKNKNDISEKKINKISIFLEDYIDHTKCNSYNGIVAIGMAEHLGLGGYKDFFKKTHNLLKVNGTLLVHMIVKPESNIPTNTWIDKYIFPGGYAPSVKEITEASENENFRIKGVYIHSPLNYKRTLFDWRLNLIKNKNKILETYQGKYNYSTEQSEYLYKQWEIYFAGSESSFSLKNKPLQVAHFVFTKTS